MTLMQRRRALIGAKNLGPSWERTPDSLSEFLGSSIYDASNDTLTVTTANYGSANDSSFRTEAGYDYKVECDVEIISGGPFVIAVRSSNNSILRSAATDHTSHIELLFPHDSNITKMSLFASFGNSIIGTSVVSHYMVWRKPQ